MRTLWTVILAVAVAASPLAPGSGMAEPYSCDSNDQYIMFSVTDEESAAADEEIRSSGAIRPGGRFCRMFRSFQKRMANALVATACNFACDVARQCIHAQTGGQLLYAAGDSGITVLHAWAADKCK